MSGKGNQLFAQRVDESLCDVLYQDVASAFDEIHSGLSEKFKPECQAVIMLAFYYLSFVSNRPTPGMSTFTLRLVESIPADLTNNKWWKYRGLLAITSYVLATWIMRRLWRIASLQGWRNAQEGSTRKKLWRLLQVFDTVSKIVDVTNFMAFLYHGAYPHFMHRLAGMRMTLQSDVAAASAATAMPQTTAAVSPSNNTDANNIMSSGSSGTMPGYMSSGSSGTMPGYSRVQVYVRSRQLLWHALAGLLSAGSLVVNWRQVVQNTVYTIEDAADRASETFASFDRRLRSVHASIVRYISEEVFHSSSFLSGGGVATTTAARRGPASAAGAATATATGDDDTIHPPNTNTSSGNTATTIPPAPQQQGVFLLEGERRATAAGGSGSSTGSSSSSSSSSLLSPGRPTLVEQEQRQQDHESKSLICNACGAAPPEAPHTPACGHIFCYVCLRSRVPVPAPVPGPTTANSAVPTNESSRNSSSSRNIRNTGTETDGNDVSAESSSSSRSGDVGRSRIASSNGSSRSGDHSDRRAGADHSNYFKCPVCLEPAKICKRWIPPSNNF